VSGKKEREITYCQFNFNFNLMFKLKICYTEMTNLLQFTVNVSKSLRTTSALGTRVAKRVEVNGGTCLCTYREEMEV
jgi:hypothetical protein